MDLKQINERELYGLKSSCRSCLLDLEHKYMHLFDKFGVDDIDVRNFFQCITFLSSLAYQAEYELQQRGYSRKPYTRKNKVDV